MHVGAPEPLSMSQFFRGVRREHRTNPILRNARSPCRGSPARSSGRLIGSIDPPDANPFLCFIRRAEGTLVLGSRENSSSTRHFADQKVRSCKRSGMTTSAFAHHEGGYAPKIGIAAEMEGSPRPMVPRLCPIWHHGEWPAPGHWQISLVTVFAGSSPPLTKSGRPGCLGRRQRRSGRGRPIAEIDIIRGQDWSRGHGPILDRRAKLSTPACSSGAGSERNAANQGFEGGLDRSRWPGGLATAERSCLGGGRLAPGSWRDCFMVTTQATITASRRFRRWGG